MLLFVLLLSHFFPNFGEAAARRYYDEDTSVAARELRDSIDVLRHELSNHDTEIRMCEERSNNQESTISSLRQQVLDMTQANKELVKGNASSLENKLSAFENTNKSLIADIGQLKNHANETAGLLSQYKQKIGELEKLIDLQSQNIDNLQSAMKSLMEAMGKGSVSSEGSKLYKIKNGDSLEKIARANNTTIKAIKELNGISSDRIIVGQTLQIP